MRRKGRNFVLSIIFLSGLLFVHEAIGSQSSANAKTISFLTMKPAKMTIRIGETATINLIANYENGGQEIVKTVKFKGEKTGFFPVNSEYKDVKTAVPAKVFVIDKIGIKDVFFRPGETTIGIGDTAVLYLIATYNDDTEGLISTEEFRGDKLGTFPISSSFEAKKATASVIVKEDITPEETIVKECPMGNTSGICKDCHAVASHKSAAWK